MRLLTSVSLGRCGSTVDCSFSARPSFRFTWVVISARLEIQRCALRQKAQLIEFFSTAQPAGKSACHSVQARHQIQPAAFQHGLLIPGMNGELIRCPPSAYVCSGTSIGFAEANCFTESVAFPGSASPATPSLRCRRRPASSTGLGGFVLLILYRDFLDTGSQVGMQMEDVISRRPPARSRPRRKAPSERLRSVSQMEGWTFKAFKSPASAQRAACIGAELLQFAQRSVQDKSSA